MGFAGADNVDGGAGTDTIALTATSTDLNSAANNRIRNVEAVSAATAAAGVTINLSAQNDGFTITGSDFGDTITGSAPGDDTINAGAGADTINGFIGADTVDGGARNRHHRPGGHLGGPERCRRCADRQCREHICRECSLGRDHRSQRPE